MSTICQNLLLDMRALPAKTKENGCTDHDGRAVVERLADAKRRREAARPDLSRSMISGRHFRSSEPCDVRFRALPLRPSAQVRVAGIESLERLALHTLPGAEVSKG
jgi:hypothetical protein